MAALEGYKQLHDKLKQLTTLNTGAIGLLVVFVEKLVPAPSWKFLIAIAMVLLAPFRENAAIISAEVL